MSRPVARRCAECQLIRAETPLELRADCSAHTSFPPSGVCLQRDAAATSAFIARLQRTDSTATKERSKGGATGRDIRSVRPEACPSRSAASASLSAAERASPTTFIRAWRGDVRETLSALGRETPSFNGSSTTRQILHLLSNSSIASTTRLYLTINQTRGEVHVKLLSRVRVTVV